MKKYIAEFLGTFTILFFGTGSIIVNQQTNGVLTHLGICTTFGLVVMVMIYALGTVSGAHFNPAVTMAFSLAKKFNIREAIPYIISQVAGALAASLLLKFLFPENVLLGATMPSGSTSQAFILEYILTFTLMMVILQVATGSKEQGMFAGIAIGFMVMLAALFAGPICGASMNPARSLAPALVSGHLEHLWIYLSAPFAGAFTATPVWYFFKSK